MRYVLPLLMLAIPASAATKYSGNPVSADAGFASTVNKTTTPLAANAVFTGTKEQVLQYSQINIVAFADATGTLSMEFSPDGTNWDRRIEVSVASGTSEAHTLTVIDEYFRMVYTNGSTAQTVFRLNAIYNRFQGKPKVSRTSQSIQKDEDVFLTRGVSDFNLDVSRGLYDYITDVHVFGRNDLVGDGTLEDLWFVGGNINWLTAADEIRIASGGNVNDTSSGSGARLITVTGLDENWQSTSTTLTPAGASASALSTTTFIRVFEAYVEDAGTYTGNNTGDITIETQGGTVVGKIETGLGKTQLGSYTVPLDYTCYLTSFRATVDSKKAAHIFFWHRPEADDTSVPVRGKRLISRLDSINRMVDFTHTNFVPAFQEKTDIWLGAQGDGAIASVSGEIELWCIQNSGSPGSPT